MAGRSSGRLSVGNEAHASLLRNSQRLSAVIRDLSVVAAGHASRGGSNIKVVEGKSKYILKLVDDSEVEIYKYLFPEPNDLGVESICAHIPNFAGVVKHDESTYMKLRNVLAGYRSPKVMDIKIGIRTFLESECENPKPRPDLYRRMAEMFPDDVLDVERKARAITKHRWMTLRDRCSTTGELGFRIDGIAGCAKQTRTAVQQELAALRTIEDVVETLRSFCEAAATNNGDDEDAVCSVASVAGHLLASLHSLFRAMHKSVLVSTHEFIGTSVLLVADSAGQAEVSWIDFAKTAAMPEGVNVTHEKPWTLGNHEDGLFIGMQNLMRALAVVAASRASTSRAIRTSFQHVLPKKRLSMANPRRRSSSAGDDRELEDVVPHGGGSAVVQEDIEILSSLSCYRGATLSEEVHEKVNDATPAEPEAKATAAVQGSNPPEVSVQRSLSDKADGRCGKWWVWPRRRSSSKLDSKPHAAMRAAGTAAPQAADSAAAAAAAAAAGTAGTAGAAGAVSAASKADQYAPAGDSPAPDVGKCQNVVASEEPSEISTPSLGKASQQSNFISL